MTSFIAVDGEADSQGRYIIMCDSTGRKLVNLDGITSRQALDWLLELAGCGAEVVCFGLNYDANQWVADLGERELRRLASDGRTVWQLRYKLTWTPAKSFEIKDHKTRRWIKICEVFGFFQSSFVKALADWGLQPPAEIEVMKKRRGSFTSRELDRIISYCQAECQLLVELMNRLAQACADAECVPARNYWIGAGSIASALLRRSGVKHAHAYDVELADRELVESHILGAYFGGRVELLAQGVMDVCQTRDLRSAYPAAATDLPSLAGARTRYRKHYKPDIQHAIWRVRWTDQAHGQLAPFPCRQTDGSIIYPQSGQGAYHASEIRAALCLGYQLEILDGLELVLRPGAGRPFDWIPTVFRQRARLKAAGHPAEKALKLGLNSVYGKLAQGYGHGQPPYQSYWWAGYITAATRAKMLRLAHASDHVAMISTDGLFAHRAAVKGSAAPTLGSWEPDQVNDLFCAQPGVYHGYRGDREIVKSRGFFAREISYEQLRETWLQDGANGVYHYDSRRFLGLRVCLHRNRLDLWRQWVDERRSISLEPARKIIPSNGRPPAWHPRTNMQLLYPPPVDVQSMPYTPKQSLYDDPQDADLENMIADDQPHYESL